MRDGESYLNDIITANVTISSLSRFKDNIRDLDSRLLDVDLPMPKIYERTVSEILSANLVTS